MKKILSIILVVALFTTVALTAVGCSCKKNPDPTTSNSEVVSRPSKDDNSSIDNSTTSVPETSSNQDTSVEQNSSTQGGDNSTGDNSTGDNSQGGTSTEESTSSAEGQGAVDSDGYGKDY